MWRAGVRARRSTLESRTLRGTAIRPRLSTGLHARYAHMGKRGSGTLGSPAGVVKLVNTADLKN